MNSNKRSRIRIVLLTMGAALTTISCAAMQAQYVAEVCTPSAAYAAGINDAKNRQDMKGNYAAGLSCPQFQASLNQSYAEGFRFALDKGTAGPDGRFPGYECKSSFGNKVCGYHCVHSMGTVLCAARPDQMCLQTDFGKMACGYGCAISQNTIKCAQRKNESCVADNFGNVKCGRNCRATPFGLRCDKRK